MKDFSGRDPFKDFFGDLENSTAPFFSAFETRVSEAKQALHRVHKSVSDGVMTLETDIPGTSKKDLKITFSELDGGGTRFVIRGKRDETSVKFSVTFKESVLADEAKAALSNGVLTVTVPVVSSPELNVTEVKVS